MLILGSSSNLERLGFLAKFFTCCILTRRWMVLSFFGHKLASFCLVAHVVGLGFIFDLSVVRVVVTWARAIISLVVLRLSFHCELEICHYKIEYTLRIPSDCFVRGIIYSRSWFIVFLFRHNISPLAVTNFVSNSFLFNLGV